MSILSGPAEASTRFGNFVIEALNGAVIALSAILALATLALVV